MTSELKYPRKYRHGSGIRDVVRMGRLEDGTMVVLVDEHGMPGIESWGIAVYDLAVHVANALSGLVIERSTGQTISRDEILKVLGEIFNIEHGREDMATSFTEPQGYSYGDDDPRKEKD